MQNCGGISKNLRVEKNADVPGEKSDLVYFVPEVYSTHSYLVDVNQEDLEACKNLFGGQSRDYSQEFEELVGYVVPNHRVLQNTEESLAGFFYRNNRSFETVGALTL